MNFLADESVDRPIVLFLRNLGHTVWYIQEMERGISDDRVLEIANSKKVILLTTDKDFGELVFRKKMISSGVILIRLTGLLNTEKSQIVASAIQAHQDELLNCFTVITSKTLRIRKLN